MILLQVALGGALGAMLRYGAVTGIGRLTGAGFPWGTLTVNVLGSFLMGIAAVVLMHRGAAAPFVMAGVLGGFTTFSAFSLDAMRLIEAGRIGAATAYMGGSVLACVVALALGLALARGYA
ncbi:MAG: fluoride efflux transporter CrcB [Rubricella sp.]